MGRADTLTSTSSDTFWASLHERGPLSVEACGLKHEKATRQYALFFLCAVSRKGFIPLARSNHGPDGYCTCHNGTTKVSFPEAGQEDLLSGQSNHDGYHDR